MTIKTFSLYIQAQIQVEASGERRIYKRLASPSSRGHAYTSFIAYDVIIVYVYWQPEAPGNEHEYLAEIFNFIDEEAAKDPALKRSIAAWRPSKPN